MYFSIVTPSFRNSDWLRLCIASVADQAGIEHEHIVQDAGSDDGTLEWLPHDPRVAAFVEKDSGMYDAVNRGFRRATGDYLAYLNCDEQYLPGALRAVADFFEAHPQVDIVVSDIVVTDRQGDYLCHRYALVPYWSHMWLRFNVSTSALFFRRRVLDQHGLFFSPEFKHLGDFFLLEEAVRRGLKFAELRRFSSIFGETGENISWDHSTRPEEAIRWQRTPRWVKALRYFLVQHHRLRIILSGATAQKPFTYDLYTLRSPEQRVTKKAAHPTTLWPGRRQVRWGGEKGVSLK